MPYVLSDGPPVLWWLPPGEEYDALHDAVGINCEKDTTTENLGADVKYMGLGMYVDDCVCHLT